ncbi:SMI1/KNR4 family protein [Stratiformator vulcanicus]|uniref:SMI1 / KNR4 family protein n=1 Tax=Stratiformator vulcanicus TaxID=2527980 RepID=A0A517QWZ6_9PLAN|nr:SMI1/KNR4 family protein [Stratiformator vulcanicus]QDT36161.1 SMI1 / KNR4 family protein [Stratiformator vulcanicus]
MTDWSQLPSQIPTDSESDAVFGQPASEEEISRIEGELGVRFPAELRSLYGTFNGFGVPYPGWSDDDVMWLVPPLSRLPSLRGDFQEAVSETHPDVASRYLPVIDYANGDTAGYLIDEQGIAADGIFSFEHESFEVRSDQPLDEFIQPAAEKLADLLIPDE